MAAEGALAEPCCIRSSILDEVRAEAQELVKMGWPAQVGAFAVGARARTIVKQVDATGVWRILLRAFRCVWPRVAN